MTDTNIIDDDIEMSPDEMAAAIRGDQPQPSTQPAGRADGALTAVNGRYEAFIEGRPMLGALPEPLPEAVTAYLAAERALTEARDGAYDAAGAVTAAERVDARAAAEAVATAGDLPEPTTAAANVRLAEAVRRFAARLDLAYTAAAGVDPAIRASWRTWRRGLIARFDTAEAAAHDAVAALETALAARSAAASEVHRLDSKYGDVGVDGIIDLSHLMPPGQHPATWVAPPLHGFRVSQVLRRGADLPGADIARRRPNLADVRKVLAVRPPALDYDPGPDPDEA